MRIGVIGAAGKIGQMRVQTVIENPNTELVAAHDLNLEGARAVAKGAPVFDDLDAFRGFDINSDAALSSILNSKVAGDALFDLGHILSPETDHVTEVRFHFRYLSTQKSKLVAAIRASQYVCHVDYFEAFKRFHGISFLRSRLQIVFNASS